MLLVLVTDNPPVVESQAPPEIIIVPETIIETKTVTVPAPVSDACVRLVEQIEGLTDAGTTISGTQGELIALLSDIASGKHEGMSPTEIVGIKQQARDLQNQVVGATTALGKASFYVDQNKDACTQ